MLHIRMSTEDLLKDLLKKTDGEGRNPLGRPSPRKSPRSTLAEFKSGAFPRGAADLRSLPVLSARCLQSPRLRSASSNAPARARQEVRHRQVPRCARSGMPAHLEQWKRDAASQRRRRRAEEAARLDQQGFGGDVDGFRAFLAHAFGNSARGWRVAVAPDEQGAKRASFNMFCASLRKIGYAGNVKALWRALSGRAQGDAVGLEHLEPDLADMLDVLARELSQQSPGGAATTFAEATHREPAGKAASMSSQEFLDLVKGRIEGDEEALDVHGEVHRNGPRLFAALALTDRGVLSCHEFCFLDHWAAHRLGASLPEPEAPGHVREIAAPFAAPDPGAAPHAPARPASHGGARHREPNLDDFRGHLVATFGTPARAWRMRFDLKGCGVVTRAEFKEGCRAVDWRHPHMPLWRELCALGAGQVTVRALDPETAVAVDHMREEVRGRFGSLASLWREALDPDCTGVVSRTEFVRTVGDDLGIGAAAARRVFSTLDVAGAGWLAAMECGYLEFFGRGPAIRPASEPSGDVATMFRGASAGGLGRTTPRRPQIWSPSRSTRSAQHRAFTFTQSVKHKWLASSVMDRCRAASESSLEVQQHSLQTTLSTMPHSQVFRTTNEFYRQGVRKLQPGVDPAAQTV